MISIIIPTINRTKKAINCINSILENSYQNYELIIIDQNKHKKIKTYITKLELAKQQKIVYFHKTFSSKSSAVNFALQKTNGDLIAFTDDDCIADNQWLESINLFFQKKKNKTTSALFGNVFPYQPEKHQNQFCPSTFNKKNYSISQGDPNVVHYKTIGLGNNMIIKKNIIKRLGGFKYWLGPGSIAKSAFESEYIYRILKNNYKIAFEPKCVCYHNRWLSPHEGKMLQNNYSCGLIAFHTYYLFRGNIKITKLMRAIIKDRLVTPFKEITKDLLNFRLSNFTKKITALFYLALELFFIVRGFIIGSLFAFID